MSSALRDRIQTEYATILDNASNLVKSFAVTDDQDDATKAQIPGEVPEIFAQKIVLACQNLLEINHHLKRNAILNDFVGRNAKVLQEKRELMAKAACLESAAATGHGMESCEAARRSAGEETGAPDGAPAAPSIAPAHALRMDAPIEAFETGAGQPSALHDAIAAAPAGEAQVPPSPLEDLPQDVAYDLFANFPETTEFVDMSEGEEEL